MASAEHLLSASTAREAALVKRLPASQGKHVIVSIGNKSLQCICGHLLDIGSLNCHILVVAAVRGKSLPKGARLVQKSGNKLNGRAGAGQAMELTSSQGSMKQRPHMPAADRLLQQTCESRSGTPPQCQSKQDPCTYWRFQGKQDFIKHVQTQQ